MPHYEYDKDYPFAAFITNLGKVPHHGGGAAKGV